MICLNNISFTHWNNDNKFNIKYNFVKICFVGRYINLIYKLTEFSFTLIGGPYKISELKKIDIGKGILADNNRSYIDAVALFFFVIVSSRLRVGFLHLESCVIYNSSSIS